VNGSELVAARRELGWSRSQLAAHLKMKYGRLSAIETDRDEPTAPELETIQRLLLEQLGHVLEQTGEHAIVIVPEPDENGVVRVGEWNGIRRGDIVTVAGMPALWRFLYHHVDPHQEYIEVFGPLPGTKAPGDGRKRSKKASASRSFAPERVALHHKV
jgi:transcriptional regulator with XRE-family HTH domain